jgi:hypothetical protein
MVIDFILKVDTIIELNNKPNCLFQQRKESKNSTLVTVPVPKSAEVLVQAVYRNDALMGQGGDSGGAPPPPNTEYT